MTNSIISQLDIQPAGDCAVLVRFGDGIDLETNRKVHLLSRLIDRLRLHGVGESVPGYCTLMIHYDPLVITDTELILWLTSLDLAKDLAIKTANHIVLPMVYGGSDGPDLEFVARHNHLTEDEVIRIHSSSEYSVYMMGFTPGFPYLGGMDPSIAAPRLAAPRSEVPAGSVGIAGQQTGVYSLASPGGWRIIGRVRVDLFDINRDPPFLLAPGDTVAFQPV